MRRPLLFFPTPSTASPSSRNGGGGTPIYPSVQRQSERLGPKFSRLQAALDNRRIEIQLDTPGIDPEYTVIIETYGSVSDFFKAARNIEGLEWIGEYEIRGLTPTDDFYDARNSEKPINGQVMLMLSDRRAIEELLSLWQRYIQDPNMHFQRGWAKFRDLFNLLKDIRYWNHEDRLRNTGVLEYWQEQVEYEPDGLVRFEAELWFRNDEIKRNSAQQNIIRLVSTLGGQVINTCCLPEINYHSLLLELPAVEVERILENEIISLIRCDQVMLFRPLGQMAIEPLWNSEDIASLENSYTLAPTTHPQIDLSPPVVALFDGLPLSNHPDLQGYLIVDDPDNFEENYPSQNRIHGTAMASLIVNGDLSIDENKLTSQVYVRPIMKPNVKIRNFIETLPDSELPLDIIHRAVKRLFDGDGNEPPVAPSIKVINLSIGDPNIHFNGKMSPLARLIDWLCIKYNVLFIVSAGNHSHSLYLSTSAIEFRGLSEQHRKTIFYRDLQDQSWSRKLLSPAESINALTIGSTHYDNSEPALRNGIYNIYDEEMPAAYSAHGNGYLRSIKPDIVIPGGRILHREPISNPEIQTISNYSAPGQLVASPHESGLYNNRTYMRGTSNSAALTTRASAELFTIIEQLFIQQDQMDDFDKYSPLLIKCLLTHGASWGIMYDRISHILNNSDSRELKNKIATNIGYGKPDFDRVKFCLDNRATVLGYGKLENNQAHVYKLPIPEELGGASVWRRLTVTLAWFSNPKASHMRYRDSALWFTIEGDNASITSRSQQSPDWMQVRRGTLQHEIFDGEDLLVLSEDRSLEIKVNCKSDACNIKEPLKYSLAITLEIADGVDIQLYQHIQTVLQESIQSQARTQIQAR